MKEHSPLTGAIYVASKLSLFLAELKRRKVYHVGVVYVLVGLAVAQGADWAFDLLELRNIYSQLAAILLALGLPVALVLAWAYEVRPEEPRPTVPTPTTVVEGSETEQRKSIVVLPFDNMSPDPGDAYFSDGLTEEIITHLSCCGPLRVISRSSAMALRGTQKNTRAIADELNVQYVLEGSVRKAGEDLRITAQLIHAREDEHLWAETYDGTMEDVFRIQEQTARSIVDALTLRLTPEEEERFGHRPIRDLTVYECYLRARQEQWQMTPESLDRARQHLQNGLDLVGESELLLASMGHVTAQRVALSIAPGPDYLPEAEDWAGRAFALNPDSSHGHALLGWIRYLQGNVQPALKHLKAAVDLDPNNVEALFYLAICYLSLGRVEAAGPSVELLMAIDPLTAMNYSVEGYWLFMRGETPEAIDAYRRFCEMDPKSVTGWVLLARSLILAGDEEEARKILSQTVLLPSTHIHANHGVILSHLLNGDLDQAESFITPEVEEATRYDGHLSWWMADWYAGLGKPERAVEWLQHASKIGFLNYPVISKLDRFLDGIREHPAFLSFEEELRATWKALEI